MAEAVTGPADFLAGIPLAVEPARIERELSKLWRPQSESAGARAEGVVTRACLSTLVIPLCDEEARREASDVLLELARLYPSRRILLEVGLGKGSGLEASISALCYRPSRDAPPICCEEVRLVAPPGRLGLLPSLVAALVVPDLPVHLFLGFGGGAEIEEALRGVALLLDSRHPRGGGLARTRAALERAGEESVEDIAWQEILPWRELLAEIFDDPLMRPLLRGLGTIALETAGSGGGPPPPGALLLAGWLGSRLGLEVAGRGAAGQIELARPPQGGAPSGGRVAVRFGRRLEGACGEGTLLSIHLEAGEGSAGGFLVIERHDRPQVLRVTGRTQRGCVLPRLRPLRCESAAALIGRALQRPARKPQVFREALELAVNIQ
jgi:hypothetical protein